jgi:hypothetical protein
MAIPEFLDTYSDDLLYLMDLRDSHLTHPGKKPVRFLFDQSIARIFCVLMIGSIEAMINYWKNRDNNNILAPYFQENGTNDERISAFINRFQTAGININPNILRDYLAIKYIRNSIIHSGWNQNQEAYILSRNLPIDSRQLNESHLEKMYFVNSQMMMYIASTEISGAENLNIGARLPAIKPYFSQYDIPSFLWGNLEKIDAHIHSEKKYNDTLASEILFNWKLFKELAIVGKINIERLHDSMSILQHLINEKRFSVTSIPPNTLMHMLEGIKENPEFEEIIRTGLKLKNESIPEVIESLIQGEFCYNIMSNNLVPKLLLEFGSSYNGELKQTLLDEGLFADQLFSLNRLYYNYVNKRSN